MKQKVYLFLITGCFFSLGLRAQKMNFGPIIEGKGYGSENIVGKYDTGFFVIRCQGYQSSEVNINFKPKIEKIDFSCNSVFMKEIIVYDSGTDKKEMQYDTICGLKDNMICIMYNRSFDKAYGIKISKSGIPDNTHFFIGSVANTAIHEIGIGKSLPDYRYNFCISTDSASLLAYYYKEDDPNVHCIAFDENMNRLWVKDLKVPMEGKEMMFGQCAYNGSEVVFMVNIKKTKTEKPTFAIFMYDHKSDSTSFERLEVHSAKKNIFTGPTFSKAVNSNGDVVFATVCTKDEETDDPFGIFYVRIDKNATHISQKQEVAFSSEYLKEYQAYKQKYGRNWVEMSNLILTSDKRIFFGAEEMGADRQTLNVAYTIFYYNDAVIGSILKNGTMDWVVRIPKRQKQALNSFTEPPAYSYTMDITDNKIVLTYNNNSHNMKTGIDEELKDENVLKPAKYIGFMRDSWNMCLITMDFSGNSIKKYWLNEKEDKPLLYLPNFAHFQLNNNQFVLFRMETHNGFASPKVRTQFSDLTIE